MSLSRLAVLSLVVWMPLLASCGGGGSGSGGGPEDHTLQSIIVSTGSATVPSVETTRELTATAIYADGERQDISSTVNWTSSDTEVVTVAQGGLASILIDGAVDVTATLQGVSSSTHFTVGSPLIKIVLYPTQQTPYLAPEDTMSLTARAVYASNLDRDMSQRVTWTSTDATIVSIDHALSPANTPVGTATGHKVGTATVSAILEGVHTEAALQVIPIMRLLSHYYDPVTPVVTLDASDNVHAVATFRFTGMPNFGKPVRVSDWDYDRQTSNWSDEIALDPSTAYMFPDQPAIASSPDGSTTLVWAAYEGIHAARRSANGHWSPAVLLSSWSNTNLDASNLSIGGDAHGNVLAVWRDPGLLPMAWSRYDAATDSWSPRAVIPGIGPIEVSSAFAVNSLGQAAFVSQLDDEADHTYLTQLSLFDPATGWAAPIVAHSTNSNTGPRVAVNASGDVLIASAFGNAYIRQYSPSTGFGPDMPITPDTNANPDEAEVGMNDAGDAVVMWSEGSNASVHARRYTRAGGWLPDAVVAREGGAYAGDPELLPPHVDADGRITLVFNGGEAYGVSIRYEVASGWQPAKQQPAIGHKGSITNLSFAFDSAGHATAIWAEFHDEVINGLRGSFLDLYVDPTVTF